MELIEPVKTDLLCLRRKLKCLKLGESYCGFDRMLWVKKAYNIGLFLIFLFDVLDSLPLL